MVFERSRRYYLYSEPTDMRKSFHTLGALVKHQMGLDVLSGSSFLFINRRKTHLKVLLWEGDGFSIYFKRLEQGTYEHLIDLENYQLSYEQLQLLLAGIEVKKIKKRKRFSL